MSTRAQRASGDLFAFKLDGPRTAYNLSSGWERRKYEQANAATPDFGEFDQLVFSEAKLACKRREGLTGYAWSVDHMIPMHRGGKHAWHNVQVIPARINSLKADRLIYTRVAEYAELLPGGVPGLLTEIRS